MSDGSGVYFTEIDGAENVLVRVPAMRGEACYNPAPSQSAHLVGWQPNSLLLLFVCYWDTAEARPLLSFDPLTNKAAPVLNTLAQDASWSPDGKELAYAQRGRLFIHTAEERQGSSRPWSQAYWIRWSADGQTIRFTVDKHRSRDSPA